MLTGTHTSYEFKKRKDNLDHCSYCGSISTTTLLDLLLSGAKVEVADQKYGWPHKFYVTKENLVVKFYTEHLHDPMNENIFDALHEQFALNTGFHFYIENDQITWFLHE